MDPRIKSEDDEETSFEESSMTVMKMTNNILNEKKRTEKGD
jgi:hypothetical protein